MPPWRLHDLRRTARSLMSRAKVPTDHAERVLGHVIGGVRETYDRYEYLDEKRDALTALAREKNKQFLYEATVMDGVPVFSMFPLGLPAADLNGFTGVLNSTTNVVLTEIEKSLAGFGIVFDLAEGGKTLDGRLERRHGSRSIKD